MDNELAKVKQAMTRLGEFGKLFWDYEGCPRGASGRACMPLEEEVLLMPVLTDVDGGRWIPVNAEALNELVQGYRKMHGEQKERRWIPVTERLPEYSDGHVLVTDGAQIKISCRNACYKTASGEVRCAQGYGMGMCVTHWMPLPEPPKGE